MLIAPMKARPKKLLVMACGDSSFEKLKLGNEFFLRLLSGQGDLSNKTYEFHFPPTLDLNQ